MIKIFLIEPTKEAKVFLRRYGDGPCPHMQTGHSYHNTSVEIGRTEDKDVCRFDHDRSDPRWPKSCSCGYDFVDTDTWQMFHELIYVCKETGLETTLRNAPVGACWDQPWMTRGKQYPDFGIQQDGRCLAIQTPGGPWIPSRRASNCTLPNDTEHFCWVIHGSPETGDMTVNKQGHTCQAGAGSIALPGYHGFLTNGYLTAC